MSRQWNKVCGDALGLAVRYALDRGRSARHAVVESTPALEYELLWLFNLRGGMGTLAQLFDRDLTWPQAAPTWALLAADQLVRDGFLMPHPRPGARPAFIITEAGLTRVGRRRNQGGRS